MRPMRAAAAALAILIAGCDFMSTRVAQGGGSEATNGNLAGAVLYPGGSRAEWTSVFLRPAAWIRDTARWERESVPDALADAKGFWHLDSLDTGAYRLELRGGKGRAFTTELRVGPGAAAARFDTLAPTGAVTGILAADPEGGSPGYVAAYGLDHIVRADASGRFTLAGLPRGRLRLRATAPRAGWGWPEREIVLGNAQDTLDLGILPPKAMEDEDYSAWTGFRRFTVALSGLGLTGTLREYPLLVRLAGSGADLAAAGGRDLRVSDARGRRLDCELERGPNGGDALWVRLDSLDLAGPEPVLTLHWGRPGAPDLSEGRRVFRGYDGAWHLSGDPGAGISEFADASVRGLAATGDAPAFDSALAGRAAAFSGGLHATVPEDPALKPVHGLGISAWMRARSADSTGGDVVSMGDDWGMRILPDGNLYFFAFNDPAWKPGQSVTSGLYQILETTALDLLDDRWHQVGAVFDRDSLRVFCDGAEVLRARADGPLQYPFRRDLEIGRHGARTHDKDFRGALDEIRFSREAFPAARLRLEYENLKPGSTLVRFE